MFEKVLVANRGEIAVRIIRALREMGIGSVAVYSEADRSALHTVLADEAVCIGPAKSLDSYANPIAILSAASVSGADAIHPGYGFLSERADFADLCEEMNIEFIGPSSKVIEVMGNKQNARDTMKAAGVPITPGSDGLVTSVEEAQAVADIIGYPLMIKASDGGGGKGMRRVLSADQLESLFIQAQNETQSIYGNTDLYMERIVDPAKHIEVQILADKLGNVIHLGERDCSLQRNNQKVIEFAPSLTLTEAVREELCQTAVDAAAAIGYESAGTIEFLVDKDQNFYFMEMNTRLQVEHPVTEMVTGIDIVQEQINIAQGLPLSVKQEDVKVEGLAIECRLNAENPKENFMPSSGPIDHLIFPSGGLGLRVESALYQGYYLPPFYDSMAGKIITHHKDPEKAFRLMQRALYEVSVEGIHTNVELLQALIEHPDVQADNVDTKWIENVFMKEWLEEN
ncbi:MAG: acetyl-CoA carboxylase biotin carboxylase subunit [Atopococcus tabaci]|uniref:Biotin carboxylase n=1 Tax=Atopococcus tabaci TaxID=269774 RepID=A0AA43UBX1_9LACT|nr:acetyl-CoA carboxylase biotin carboxylase subunit [Atopococcus tabaci]